MTDVARPAAVAAPEQLDRLTREAAVAVVHARVTAGAPVSFSRIPTGRVVLEPVDPGDLMFEASFNEHQRGAAGDGRLGADAVGTVAALFGAAGWSVELADSSRLLDSADRRVAEDWLGGWVSAAVKERPALAEWGAEYLGRRLSQLVAGELRIVVERTDLLAWPP